MRDRIESLEDKIMSVASQQQKATETEENTEPSEAVEANDDKETAKHWQIRSLYLLLCTMEYPCIIRYLLRTLPGV